MIPAAVISEWGRIRPWPDRLAIEQDLLLSRLLVAIYEDPLLREGLVLWGGACIHKVYLPSPRRYSKDLDFICRPGTDCRDVLRALWEVADSIGLTGPPRRWQLRQDSVGSMYLSESPKLTLRAQSEIPDRQLRFKIEINTNDTLHFQPHARVPFHVESDWFTGSSRILALTAPELISTKLNPLYERRKAQDLFDLWLGLTEMALDPADILACYSAHRPHGRTAGAVLADLDAKLADPGYRSEQGSGVGWLPAGYDVDAAAELVREQLIRHL
jgi:predicted nucleotidyltransferase component of viral defense system